MLTHPQRYAGFVRAGAFRLPDILAEPLRALYSQGGTKDVSADAVVTGKAGRQRQMTAASGDA